MSRLTDKEIEEKLRDTGLFKWECLKRSEKYIRDCEVWSGRKRSAWKDDEIIISYPWKMKVGAFVDRHGSILSRALADYNEKHQLEWGHLISTQEEINSLRSEGFKTPTTKRQYSWHRFWKDHEINLPLNPYCKYVPFFVKISPEDYIYEPYFSRPHENDPFLEKGTESLIKVNWAAPTVYLKYFFAKMIDGKKSVLAGVLKGPKSEEEFDRLLKASKGDGLIQGRSGFSFDEIEVYIKVWDQYEQCKGNYTKIAEKVWEKEFKNNSNKNITAAKQKAERFYKKADQLINGGYKTLSHRLGVSP